MPRTAECHELPQEARIATEREPEHQTAGHHARIVFGGLLLTLATTAVAVLVTAGLDGWATNTSPDDRLVWLVFVAAAAGVAGTCLLAATAPRYCVACGEELPRDAGPWQPLCDECGEVDQVADRCKFPGHGSTPAPVSPWPEQGLWP